MLGMMFVGYPFALGEKSNMDALYVTLNLNRKNVVAGRYLFALALNVCTLLFAFVLSTIGLLAASAVGVKINETETLAAVLALCAVFIVIQAIQLPLFFKLGYAKAKFFSLLPFAALMSSYIVILGAANRLNHSSIYKSLVAFSQTVGENAVLLAAVAIAAMVIAIFVSYNLSLAFYKKREF
jgi:hypothetical protein